ncbi:hypothetical protein D1007_38698 [Hordeum vulgare]|nr:hypothetical protein D1007_38698 [Hordeum vulgare]
MDDPPPNSGDSTVVPATKGKKKKAPQGTKKSRSKLTPEEIAKLDAESTKRRNRRAEPKRKDVAAAYAIELAALEAARQKADAQEKKDIVSKAHALLVMGLFYPMSFAAAPVGPNEHRLVGRPASAVPLPDVVDHAIVARFPSAKVPSPDPFVGVDGS